MNQRVEILYLLDEDIKIFCQRYIIGLPENAFKKKSFLPQMKIIFISIYQVSDFGHVLF